MEVICLEEAAFYALIEKIVARITEKIKKEDKWIPSEQAMKKLNIASKSTLQRLRNEGKIRFSQPQKKIILYDSASIDEYLNKHSRNTF